MKLHSNIFGWDYVWRDFADNKGGEVICESNKDNNSIQAIQISFADSDSILTITPHSFKGKSKSEGTCASLYFNPKEHFVFAIRSEKNLDQIGKMLGMQDIQIGDQLFDERFLIQGSDPGKVFNVFADMHIRDLLLNLNPRELRLETDAKQALLGHKIPDGKHALVYNQDTVLQKYDELENLFHAMTNIVRKLGVIPILSDESEINDTEIEELPNSKKAKAGRLHSPLLDMA